MDQPVKTMVPVSVRPRDARGLAIGDGTLANRVSAVFAALPVAEADPVARLRSISTQMDGIKESKQALAGETLTNLGGFTPPVLLALGARLGTKLSQRRVNTVTTNVPGPQVPLFAAGRQMLVSHPFVPLGMQLRIGVAIFSYNGNVSFGITGDYDSSPDIDVLANGIQAGHGRAARRGGCAQRSSRRPGSAESPPSTEPGSPPRCSPPLPIGLPRPVLRPLLGAHRAQAGDDHAQHRRHPHPEDHPLGDVGRHPDAADDR